MVSVDGEDRDGHVVVGILIVYHREPEREGGREGGREGEKERKSRISICTLTQTQRTSTTHTTHTRTKGGKISSLNSGG